MTQKREAVATQIVDNELTCVTRFDFEPGAETGWHRHGHNYVITAITDLYMRLEEQGGAEREVHVKAGEAYFREEGVEHNVINASDQLMSFVEVEFK